MESDLEGVDNSLELPMGEVPTPVPEDEPLDSLDQQINGMKKYFTIKTFKFKDAVSQIDRQIEENVILSSIENLQISTKSQDNYEPENLRLNGQPDLSIISEENSHIPTDLCTSADEMKSDYEIDPVSESQVSLFWIAPY